MHLTGLAALLAFILAAAAPLAAHVRVYPNDDITQTPACGFTKFVVRVPTEKPIPTVGVRVLIPAGITVIGVQPKPGWHADFTSSKGRTVAIAWTGGRILPREFDEFAFLAAGPVRGGGTVNWDALQTYEDRSVVRWTGNPGSDTPHAQTVFTAPLKPCRRTDRTRAVAGPHAGTFALESGTARTHGFLRAEPSAADPLRLHLDLWMTRNGSTTPIRRYSVDMTKLLHLIVVSDDLATFEHAHPVLGPDGHFTLDQRVPAPGLYHLYADAEPAGIGQQVFRFDVNAGAAAASERKRVLPAPARTVTAGPYTVQVSGTTLHAGHAADLAVQVRKGAAPARDLHPYLGASAHAVFIDAQDLSYVHVHPALATSGMASMPGMDMEMPDTDMKPLPEATTLPARMLLHVILREPGSYKLWLQFRGGNALYAAPFTVTVK